MAPAAEKDERAQTTAISSNIDNDLASRMNFNDTSRGSSLATVLGDGNAFTMIEYNGELIAENDKELFESMATDAVSSLDNQNGGGHSVFSIEPDINASHTLALKTNEEVESVALVEENDVKDAENEVGDISVLDEEHDAEDNEEEEGVAEVKDFEEKAKDEDEEEHIEEEQDRRYNQSYDKALVLGELMGYEVNLTVNIITLLIDLSNMSSSRHLEPTTHWKRWQCRRVPCANDWLLEFNGDPESY